MLLPIAETDSGTILRYEAIRDAALRAERDRFDSVWIVDHLLFVWDGQRRGIWEAWTLLAALAEATTRIELGTLVMCTAFRNPALLAKMAATIDEISGGRLILGLGAGWNEVEYHMFGFPFDHRVARFGEAYTIISGLLRDGAIDFAGQYYAARACELRPRGPRPGGPPLMVGSRGPRMLRLTLPSVPIWNGWLCDGTSSPEAYPALVEPVDAICQDIGRDPATLERTVSISIDPSGRRQFPRHWYLADDLAAARPLTGSPAAIAAGIRGFGSQGVSHLQIYPIPPTLATIEALVPILEEVRRPVPNKGGES